MHPRLIWAIARKDILDLWMNKATMAGLLFPIILSLVYLLIGKVIGEKVTNIIVYNPGNSQVVEVVKTAFSDPKVTEAPSAEEVANAFPNAITKAKNLYVAGLVVPIDFDKQLRAGSRPKLQLYFEGKSINTQTQMLIQAAITSYCRNITNPQPPVEIITTVVNTSPTRTRSVELSNVYIPLALLVSLVIGTTFMPQLLIEEKEKKTLRMLMVTPASFEDILIGKLIVVLAYQLILTGVVLVIQNAFKEQGGLVILYAVIGGIFSVALGLLFGAVFNTISAATAAEGPVLMIYILAGIFVGPLGDLLSSSPVTRIAKLIPTYYIAEGVSNATQNLGTTASHLFDIGVVVGSTVVLLAISAWALRRQSAIAAMI